MATVHDISPEQTQGVHNVSVPPFSSTWSFAFFFSFVPFSLLQVENLTYLYLNKQNKQAWYKCEIWLLSTFWNSNINKFWRIFLFEFVHFAWGGTNSRIFFKFWCFMNLPWSHVRSHKKKLGLFRRVDVYWIQMIMNWQTGWYRVSHETWQLVNSLGCHLPYFFWLFDTKENDNKYYTAVIL